MPSVHTFLLQVRSPSVVLRLLRRSLFVPLFLREWGFTIFEECFTHVRAGLIAGFTPDS